MSRKGLTLIEKKSALVKLKAHFQNTSVPELKKLINTSKSLNHSNLVQLLIKGSTMYILNDFFKALRLFVQTHAELDIDIKFPMSKHHINGHIRFYSTKNLQNLVEKLVEELTIVERCSWSSNYLSIWLKKELWASTVMKEILMSGCKYGSNDDHKDTKVVSVSFDECNDSVTYLRIVLLKEAIQNLAKMNGFTIGSDGLNLLVSKKNNPTNSNLILCGNVVCNVPVKEYKQQKQDSITKMSANHIESDEYPIDKISKLCHASIAYELLSVRHNKVINIECDTSNKDSGIFIMYNYSRLCQVWKAYEQDAIENHDSLPDICSVNFGLLTSNEEWLLIFNHLSMYPLVIQQSVKNLISANVDIHKLCKFVMEMSSAVSLFYHRHRILLNQKSLLPLMHARLYLVKTSIQVYENVFQLLGIKAVREM